MALLMTTLWVRIKGFILTLVLVVTVSQAATADLNQRWKMERRGRLDQRGLISRLAGYHVVFLGFSDFLTWLRGFRDNAETLRKDLRVSSVSFVNGLFFGTYEDNARTLAREFLRVYEAGGRKPLIVIGNPQSGPYGLYAVLKKPALLSMVAKLILLTPAFGSPLADSATSCDSRGFLPCRWLGDFFGGQVMKFRTKSTRDLFVENIRSLSPVDHEQLNAKLYYVRGASSLLRINPLLAPSYAMLRPYGPTDGVSFTRDQKLAGIGTDLGVVPVNHWDLFASMPPANSPASFRKTFTRALLKEVFTRIP